MVTKRPKFQRMIKNALDGKYNLLVFKDIKRMTRNNEDLLHITEELKRKKIYCYFITESISTEFADRVILSMLGGIAESHSNALHHTITASFRINAERECGRVPSKCFGYTKPITKDSSELYINEETSKIVYEIFLRYANRESTSSIVDSLNARGIKTVTGSNFTFKALWRVIRNPLYKGVLVMNKSIRTDVRAEREYLDPSEYIVRSREDLRIVSDELWEKANNVLKENGKNVKNQYSGNNGKV